MKKGIAMLVALFFIAAMALLLDKSFSISEDFRDDGMVLKNLSQINLVVKDSKDILGKLLVDINSSEALDFLYSQPFVLDGASFDLMYRFSPVDNAININKIMKEDGKSVDEEFKKLVEDIFLTSNIIDPNFLINILLDTIDDDQEERVYGSEIALRDKTFSNGKIYSMDQFEKIIDYYAKETNDVKIYKTDWSKYFNCNAKSIDINFASLDLIKVLLPNRYIDKNFKEFLYDNEQDLTLSDDEKNSFAKYGVVFSSQNLKCDISYIENEKSATVEFYYNMSTKASTDFKYTF